MTPEPAQPAESPQARASVPAQPRWLGCMLPPEGWWCSREEGHDGPCAACPDEPPEDYDSPLSDADKARIDAAWGSYKPLLAASTARPTERNIVLTSQLAHGADGFEIHGIFPSFRAAALHIVKDADLGDVGSTSLLIDWREAGDRREYVGPGSDGQATHWCASVQPVRSDDGCTITARSNAIETVETGPQDCMWRSGHDGEGPDPSKFFCDVIGPAPSCHLYRAVADTEAEARTLAFRKADPPFEAARPTARGAVGAVIVQAVEDAANDDCRPSEAVQRILAALPATDQAAEVERNLEMQRQTIEACARVIESHPMRFAGFTEQAVRSGFAKAVRALRPNEALATQPATGRTMGGEDGLREAGRMAQRGADNLFHELNRDPNWRPTRSDYQTLGYLLHNIAGAAGTRAALQNGGE